MASLLPRQFPDTAQSLVQFSQHYREVVLMPSVLETKVDMGFSVPACLCAEEYFLGAYSALI